MIVLSIGTDRKIFEKGSAVRERMIEYGRLFNELHIIIFSLSSGGYEAEKISDNVWIYPTKSKSRWFYVCDALKTFKRLKIKPSVVTAQDPFETGLAGWRIARRGKSPLHVQIHTDFLSPYFVKGSLLNRLRVYIAKFILKRAAAIRVVSERIKNSLSKLNKDFINRTRVLPIYTDIGYFKAVVPSIRNRFVNFSFVILAVSRLSPEKNLSDALIIFKKVVIKHHDSLMVIVGEGEDKKRLQALSKKLRIDKNIIFEPWQRDLRPFYQSADVFLTTSLFEGYGLTLLEAAASGCPIISSDVGIAPELVREGKNGFICNLENLEEFSYKINLLIENSEQRSIVKAEAVALAENLAVQSKDEYLRKYKEILEEAAKTNKK